MRNFGRRALPRPRRFAKGIFEVSVPSSRMLLLCSAFPHKEMTLRCRYYRTPRITGIQYPDGIAVLRAHRVPLLYYGTSVWHAACSLSFSFLSPAGLHANHLQVVRGIISVLHCTLVECTVLYCTPVYTALHRVRELPECRAEQGRMIVRSFSKHKKTSSSSKKPAAAPASKHQEMPVDECTVQYCGRVQDLCRFVCRERTVYLYCTPQYWTVQ